MLVMTVAFFVSQKVDRFKVSSLHSRGTSSLQGLDDRESGRRFSDLVDIRYLDLYSDEHEEDEDDKVDDELRAGRMKGKWRLLWRLWYWLA